MTVQTRLYIWNFCFKGKNVTRHAIATNGVQRTAAASWWLNPFLIKEGFF